MKIFSGFILIMLIMVILYFLLGVGLFSGGTGNEGLVYIFGTLIIILLSFITSLLVHLIGVINKNLK
ncbi:hypothetical protein BSG1_04545 [Bacillus sp. SG-1]|nr:hypothetical protein BSG1_04545 [Bacillus sp. SG-1]